MMKRLMSLLIWFTLLLIAPVVGAAPHLLQASSGETYVVQVEDRLSKIAEKYYNDPALDTLIVEATNAKAAEDGNFISISNPDLVEAGQKLWIPGLGAGAEAQPMAARELEARETTAGLLEFEFDAETGDIIEIKTNIRPETVMILNPEPCAKFKAGERVTFPLPLSQTDTLTRLMVPLKGHWHIVILDSSSRLEATARLISGLGVDLYEADELSSGMSEARTQDFIRRVVEATNEARQEHGCSPVTLNKQLSYAAQSHSMNMAFRDFFGHTGKDESTAADRVSATGYRWQTVAENLTAGYSTPEQAIQAWLNGEGHRRNLLNCDFIEIGVGVHYLQNDTGRISDMNYYWTQVFATPLEE